MSKKRGGESLTGGTGDVNPQYMHGILTLSAANTITTATLGTPIVRVGPQSGGQAIIMEVLKIFCNMPDISTVAAGATQYLASLSFATTDQGTSTASTFDNSRIFAFFQRSHANAFTAAGTGLLQVAEDPQVYDCTDGSGHGVLIATDNIFLQGNSTNAGAAVAFSFKILYRFKKVSLIEYIGIVQSQQ